MRVIHATLTVCCTYDNMLQKIAVATIPQSPSRTTMGVKRIERLIQTRYGNNMTENASGGPINAYHTLKAEALSLSLRTKTTMNFRCK